MEKQSDATYWKVSPTWHHLKLASKVVEVKCGGYHCIAKLGTDLHRNKDLLLQIQEILLAGE